MRQTLIAIGVVTALMMALVSPSTASDEIDSLRTACEGGNFNSCNDLGFMYLYGQDVDKDTKKYLLYTGKACEGGNALACSNLAKGYLHGDVEGVEQDQVRALVFFQKACDGGEFKECTRLGWVYLDGKIAEQDYARSLRNFQKTCSDGGVFEKGEGCYGVGEIYRDGLGVEKDFTKVLKFYSAACDAKSADGCVGLGNVYEEGIGVEPNFPQSIVYYGKACDAGLDEACNFVGKIYEEGTEVDRDKTLAGHYYRKACELNNAEGCDNRRNIYPDQGCPCFIEAEILAVCPRPDSDHTESYDIAQDGKSQILKCFATRNYSTGSIQFEAGVNSDGGGQYCAHQSVEVDPYGSGGKFPPVSPTEYAACKLVLEDVAKKLGIQ